MAGIIDTHDNDRTHYHVVAFINGCLNDYDSGPFDTWQDAQSHLCNDVVQDYIEQGDTVEQRSVTRYMTSRGYILQVEDCQEEECDADDMPY